MRGDETRAFGAYFASVNRNKRGIVLDLRLQADRQVVLDLVVAADALVENFRPGVMERFDLGYEVLHDANPRLVYGAIRGFGDPRTGAGPYTDWPSYDVIAQAMGGPVSFTGPEKTSPLRVGPSIGDIYPATVAAFGITAAILHARATGEGQFVDISMQDSLVALCEAAVYTYSYSGYTMTPTGNRHPQLSPFDVFPTLDGACAIAAPTTKHWLLLCKLIDRPDLVDDARTLTNRDRVKNADLVGGAVRDWTSSRTTAEIVEVLGGVVPVGPVATAADLLDDPHLRAREMFVAVEQPGAPRPGIFPNSPIRMTETPVGVYSRAPLLGEHTESLRRGEVWLDERASDVQPRPDQ
jgi:crotonobetainyl-CoA:carnitine CoA-transferase CaiB-like acyl-CoA transferase